MYAKGAFLLVIAIALIYACSLSGTESVVVRNGSVVKFYKVKEMDSVYLGSATLEDTTISNDKALKVFRDKDRETKGLIFNDSLGIIKRKQKTPQ